MMTVKHTAKAKSASALAEPVKKTTTRKAAARKTTTRIATAAKPAAADKKTVKKTAGRKTAAKKAVLEAVETVLEIRTEPEAIEVSAPMASRKELARKSTEENNVQKNLSARSAAAAKAAAQGFKKPARKKASRAAAKPAVSPRIVSFKGLPEEPGKSYAEVIAAKEAAGALASRKELAQKSVDENNVQKNLAARSAAALKAFNLEQSDQNASVRDERLAVIGEEAMDGEKIIEAIDKITDAPYQEGPAQKAEILAGSHQSAALRNERLETINEEVKDGQKIVEAIDKIDDAPYQKEPAKKAKKSVKSSQKAQEAEILAGSDQSAAVRDARLANIAAEAEDGQKIIEAIDKIDDAPYQKAAKPKKARAARNKKAEEAQILAGSHQSAALRSKRLETINEEVKDGQKIVEAIDKIDDAPYQKEETAAKPDEKSAAAASRKELAVKSAEENNVQTNLSARSKAAAAAGAKGFKKPARRKKAKAAAAIPVESNAAKNLESMIPEVAGTPYEKVLEQVKEKAAMESRKELAARSRKVLAKPSVKDLSEEQKNFYGSLDDNTLLEMANAAGLNLNLDQLKEELTKAPDVDEQVDKYLAKVAKASKPLVYSVDGFDASVIPFLCKKIAATLPNKAQDNVDLAKKITKDTDRMLINEGMNDSAIYKDLLDDVRQILVIAQHNNLHTLDEVEEMIPADLHKLVNRFMDVAYTILPGWQYNDVKYYEGFIYGVMAQFDDLANLQNKALMDIADLYIKHGDYQKGNDGYGYVLRENQLKDQIYYRFADVYVPIDLQRAKSIAQDALRIIDGRYDYYPKIIEILQK